jgi:hypothetical protein
MSDVFGDYLHTIGRIPMLTPAEELHLGAVVWDGSAIPNRTRPSSAAGVGR